MTESALRLDQDRRDLQKLSRLDPVKGQIGRTGRHTMRIPASAFFNAVEANGGVGKDGKTVWDDPTYSKDMQRLYPECAVQTVTAKTVFSFISASRDGKIPKNRFGRPSFRKVYA